MALVYAITLTVVLNLLFLPDTPKAAEHRTKSERGTIYSSGRIYESRPRSLRLKVMFAAMFCYIVYEAIDWSGIHTAFITCTFIWPERATDRIKNPKEVS